MEIKGKPIDPKLTDKEIKDYIIEKLATFSKCDKDILEKLLNLNKLKSNEIDYLIQKASYYANKEAFEVLVKYFNNMDCEVWKKH